VGVPRQPAADAKRTLRLEQFIESHLGPIQADLFEEASGDDRIGVYVVAPAAGREFVALLTGGMSRRPMAVPGGCEPLALAELAILLPPDWPLSRDALAVEEVAWPVYWLIALASYPHEYGTWLGPGHVFPNGDPAQPLAPGTQLCGVLVSPSVSLPDAFDEIAIPGSGPVRYYALYPLHRKELEHARRHGAQSVLEALGRRDVGDVVDLLRPDVCAGA
jgi:hypothetical protein